jgi:hypothetical protein
MGGQACVLYGAVEFSRGTDLAILLSPENRERLRRVEELPPADQRAVLKLVDAILETRRRSAPPSPTRRRKAS